MKARLRSYLLIPAACALPLCFLALQLLAQDAHFHNAPSSSTHEKNPFDAQSSAIAAGAKLYATSCASCHGATGQGTGNIPALSQGATQTVPEGEVFWFITNGSPSNGMPAWGQLPAEERWQIVSFLRSLKNSPVANASPSASFTPVKTTAPLPQPPFTDFRVEEPGKVRKITVSELPAPYATDSANNGPQVVARPAGAWPKAPEGFTVQLYATGLDNPRLIRTAPNGDFFLAESSAGTIRVFRGITADGKPKEVSVFASGLTRPYG
ncbi:MAG: cytochrome c, partial [Candidatus Acidiferrum sp.]